jgi:UDP-N-acetyl-D-glucosamine dehydrogenase
LPISLTAAACGYKVIGVDVDDHIVNNLNNGKSHIADISSTTLIECLDSGNFIASKNIAKIEKPTINLVCVPTPLDKSGLPDLVFVISAIKMLAKTLIKGDLIIIESTIAPGTTRELIVPLIETESGLSRNDFLVAFSPERIDPLSKVWNLQNTPKLVAGITLEARNQAVEFYSKFIESIEECDTVEIAETAKLLENSFRLLNISFINEISMFCNKFGIDVLKVIKAASTKPYGFLPFYPSIGVGGHCIPVDPIYLTEKAKDIGAPVRLIELADQINMQMPEYFVSQAKSKLTSLTGKKILVIGVSYKPNISDTRQTPVKALIEGLRDKSAQVSWHDDIVKAWNGEKSVTLSTDFDLAIIATPHDYLDLTKLGNVPILNTRGSI